jgi:hypothetical protein
MVGKAPNGASASGSPIEFKYFLLSTGKDYKVVKERWGEGKKKKVK